MAVPVALLYIDELAASGEYSTVSVSVPALSDPEGMLIVALPAARVVAAEV